MEYKATYEIDRKIHARTSHELRKYMIELEREGIKGSVKNLANGKEYDNESIINSMLIFAEGSQVEIVAIGEDKENFSIKDAVKGIGGYFKRKQNRLNALGVGVKI